MSTAIISSKGQVTIPKKIRELLGLEVGDQIDFIPENNQSVFIRPKDKKASDLLGILQEYSKEAEAPSKTSIEDMDQSIVEFHRKSIV